jgi:hypothetical protein
LQRANETSEATPHPWARGGGVAHLCHPPVTRTVNGLRILNIKKRLFYPSEVWREALCDFRNELYEDVEGAEKDQLRFQNGRLFRSLVKRIKAEATGRDQWGAMVYCYRFVTKRSLHFGYDEARRLHGEEMAARGAPSPGTFCSRPVSDLDELMSRVCSIASWMEAQESFSVWLIFKKLSQAWRGDIDERARALQACYLSQLPHGLTAKQKSRIGTNYSNEPWTDRQWKNILEHSVRLTKKRYACTELEKLVWWCYPVFRRYRWNTREVLNVASEREIDFEKEKAGIDKLIRFQKYWIRRGLRFTGGKQKQNRTPPLAEFVRSVVLPDSKKMWGSLGGFLFLPKKN